MNTHATPGPRRMRPGDRVRYVRATVPLPASGDPWVLLGETGTVEAVHAQRDPDTFGHTLVRVVIDGREAEGWVPFAADELEHLTDTDENGKD